MSTLRLRAPCRRPFSPCFAIRMPDQNCEVKNEIWTSIADSQDRQLTIDAGGRRKRGKVAELLLEVKNLFLKIDHLAGAQLRQLHTAFGHLQLPPHDRLPQAKPPLLSQLCWMRRHPLQ